MPPFAPLGDTMELSLTFAPGQQKNPSLFLFLFLLLFCFVFFFQRNHMLGNWVPFNFWKSTALKLNTIKSPQMLIENLALQYSNSIHATKTVATLIAM